jgi:hypothetical protein
MICQRFDNYGDISYAVKLNEKEWTKRNWAVDTDWRDRPIRKWVCENCFNAFFGSAGNIYFYDEDQFWHFWLTWAVDNDHNI